MNRSQRMRRKRQMQKRRRFFSFLFIVLAILIVKKIDIPGRLKSNVADASTLSESIELMSENSPLNVAYREKKKEVIISRIEDDKKERVKAKDKKDRKIAYLTFNDGPSDLTTPKVLDVLKEYNVKATFFIIGKNAENRPQLIKRIKEEGHGLGSHTYTNNYGLIYSNTETFISEMEQTEGVLKKILGQDYTNKLIRFPGGSQGDKRSSFREAAMKKGYKYYDWNALIGDAEAQDQAKDVLLDRLKETYQGQKELVVLMHDTGASQTTADALPEIIEFLKSEGYEFDVLR